MGQIKWRYHKSRRKTMFFCCLETPAIPRTPTVVVHPAPTPRCCSSNPSLTLCSPLESLGLNVGRQAAACEDWEESPEVLALIIYFRDCRSS